MTQQKLCVRGCENGQGGALYDTVMVICRGCMKTVRGCII